MGPSITCFNIMKLLSTWFLWHLSWFLRTFNNPLPPPSKPHRQGSPSTLTSQSLDTGCARKGDVVLGSSVSLQLWEVSGNGLSWEKSVTNTPNNWGNECFSPGSGRRITVSTTVFHLANIPLTAMWLIVNVCVGGGRVGRGGNGEGGWWGRIGARYMTFSSSGIK